MKTRENFHPLEAIIKSIGSKMVRSKIQIGGKKEEEEEEGEAQNYSSEW